MQRLITRVGDIAKRPARIQAQFLLRRATDDHVRVNR